MKFIFQSIDELWVSIKKDSKGIWKIDGKELTEFHAHWGIDEPIDTPGADCASFSKSKDYKLKASACFEQKHFLCMAMPPDCPHGYTWIPLYGKGKSCFKIKGPIIEAIDSSDSYSDLTIADFWCQKENTRPFVPETVEDSDALSAWIQEPDKEVFLVKKGRILYFNKFSCI